MTDEPTTIRCSDLDSLMACAPSVLNTQALRISPQHEASQIGRAVHECAADYVENGTFNTSAACQHAGLGEGADEEVNSLMLYGQKAWDELSRYFPTPRTETIITSDPLTVNGQQYQIAGTCDVISPVGTDKAIFADWKTGYLDDGYYQQLSGYAYNAWCVLGKPDSVTITGIAVFLRHRYYRVMKWNAQRLRDWEYDLTHNVLSKPDEYRPGKQCKYCDLYATCSARKAVVEGTLDTMLFRNSTGQHAEYQKFLDDARELLAGLTEENKDHATVAEAISTLLFRMRMGQQAIEDTRNLLRSAVERVGPIKLDERTALALRDVEVEKIDPNRALRTLRQHLSGSQICGAMKLSLPKLLKAYGDMRQQGEKVADRRRMLKDKLERADAIRVEHQKRMEEVDISDVEPQQQSNDQATPTGADTDGSTSS